MEYNEKKELPRQTNANIQPDSQSRTFAAHVFGFSQSQVPIEDELSCYLNEIKIPQAFPETDPFK